MDKKIDYLLKLFYLYIGIIILIDDKQNHQTHTQVQIKKYEQNRLQEENIQLQDYINSIEEKKLKIELLRKSNDLSQDIKDIKGKRDKKKRPNDPKEKDTLLQQKQILRDQQNSLILENNTSKISGFAPVINIKTTSSSFAWYDDNSNCYSSIDIVKQKNLWTWPNTQKDLQKYKVYCDLWDRGYYITSGIKFGGDYLLYPGNLNYIT